MSVVATASTLHMATKHTFPATGHCSPLASTKLFPEVQRYEQLA